MKKIITGLFFLSVLSAICQVRQFPKDSAQWICKEEGVYFLGTPGIPPAFNYIRYSFYEMKGDTLINSQLYKKITGWKIPQAYAAPGTQLNVIGPYYYGGLRYDSISSKLYFIDSLDTEKPYVKFNDSIGYTCIYDTVKHWSDYCTNDSTVFRITDSLITFYPVFNNVQPFQYPVRYLFFPSYGWPNNISAVLEGVGLADGIFETICGNEFHENRLVMFCDLSTDTFTCFKHFMFSNIYLGTNQLLSDSKKTELYPNPSNILDKTHLKLPEKNCLVEIYNSAAQKCSGYLCTGLTTELNFPGKGIYLIKILHPNGKIECMRSVVE